MITAIHMHEEQINPETTKPQMQTVFKRKGSAPGQTPVISADEVIVSPEPPINSIAKLIKTPASLGLESVGVLFRATTGGHTCLEPQFRHSALLKARAPTEINRYSLSYPSTSTHQLQFLRMAERRAVQPGDIILLYNPHTKSSPAPRNAQLVMALVVSLAKEGKNAASMHVWHGLLSHTHNRLLEIWETVNKPSSPQTYLKTQNVDRVPIHTHLAAGNNSFARYLNTPLHAIPLVVGPPAVAAQATSQQAQPPQAMATLQQAQPPQAMTTLQQAQPPHVTAQPPAPPPVPALPPRPASSTFTFGAPPPASGDDGQGAAKRQREG